MQQTLDTLAGKVSAKNAYGIKLENRGDEWVNFSKPEYRGHWEEPEIGDIVKLGVARGSKGGLFIKTCEVQKHGNGPATVYEDGRVPAGGKDLGITRSCSVYAATNAVVALIAQRCYIDSDGEPMLEEISVDIRGLAEKLERHMLREDVQFS